MRIKLEEGTKKPIQAYPLDAGIDVFAPSSGCINPKERCQIKLGFSIEIENDEMILMSERSGMAINYGITSIGNVIDAGYRGIVSIILYNSGDLPYFFNKGDKIGQMLIVKLGQRKVDVVDYLTETDRGDNAHNSSGI